MHFRTDPTTGWTMTNDESARRSRPSKLSKQARFEEAFQRARRELKMLETTPPAISPTPIPGFAQRHRRDREINRMPTRGSAA